MENQLWKNGFNIKKKKSARQKTIRTLQNVTAAVRDALIMNPSCSAQKHAVSLKLSSRSQNLTEFALFFPVGVHNKFHSTHKNLEILMN